MKEKKIKSASEVYFGASLQYDGSCEVDYFGGTKVVRLCCPGGLVSDSNLYWSILILELVLR